MLVEKQDVVIAVLPGEAKVCLTLHHKYMSKTYIYAFKMGNVAPI